MDPQQVTFSLDGQALFYRDMTIAQCGIQDGDVVDVMVDQVGD